MNPIDAPVEAKCAGCGHRYHFPLRCGYVIEPETEEDFSGRKCECLSDVKAVPVEDTAVDLGPDIEAMLERSKCDSVMIVGSEMRILIQSLRAEQARTRELEKRLAEALAVLRTPPHLSEVNWLLKKAVDILSQGSEKTK